MASRSTRLRLTAPLLASLAACSPPDPCEALAGLCAASRVLDPAARPDDALALDLDGDGVDEVVALTRAADQLALAHTDDRRSLLFLPDHPIALAPLRGEFAVAVTDPPALAIFAADADGRLTRRRDLPLPAAPHALQSADLDGDGAPELVAALASGRVAVVDPTTGTTTELTAGAPGPLLLADVDADTHFDILTADRERPLVHLLRGEGGRTFAPARDLPAGAVADALAVADHDADGRLDLLLRSPSVAGVILLRGEPDAAFAPAVPLLLRDTAPAGAGLVAHGGGAVSMPRGESLTTWFSDGHAWLGHTDHYAGDRPAWVGAATADGFLVAGDASVVNFTRARTMTPVELWREPGTARHDRYGPAEIGDLDGDGLLDFVIAEFDELIVFRARPGLGFTRAASIPLDPETTIVRIADVTGDARPDIVVAGRQAMVIVVGHPDGFLTTPPFVPSVPPQILTVLRADPGAASLVIAAPGDLSSPTPAVQLRFGADGQLVTDTTFADDLGVARVLPLDLDADGRNEPLLLALRGATPVLARMLPDGPGFAPGPEYDLPALTGLPVDELVIRDPVAGDLDGDGDPEVVLPTLTSVLAIAGLADDDPVVTTTDLLSEPTHLRDLDGDGHLDAAEAAYGRLRYQRGRGDGTFDPDAVTHSFPDSGTIALTASPSPQFDVLTLADRSAAIHRLYDLVRPDIVRGFSLPGPTTSLAVGDIDRDGRRDLVSLSWTNVRGIVALMNDERAPFARGDGFQTLYHSVRRLTLGDLDADGIPEALTFGDGAFFAYPLRAPHPALPLGLQASRPIYTAIVADLDADGLVDVATIETRWTFPLGAVFVAVYHGQGDLAFADPVDAATFSLEIPTSFAAALTPGDCDGDGDLDLLLQLEGDLPAALLRNTGPRTWAEPTVLPGTVAAVFTAPDAAGRVEVVAQDTTEIFRLSGGDPARRERLMDTADRTEVRLHMAADVDADDRFDLLLRTETATEIWLRRDDAPEPALALPHSVMEVVAVTDLDGDRRPDLVGLADGRIVLRLSGT